MMELMAAVLVAMGFSFAIVGLCGFLVGGVALILCGIGAMAWAILQ